MVKGFLPYCALTLYLAGYALWLALTKCVWWVTSSKLNEESPGVKTVYRVNAVKGRKGRPTETRLGTLRVADNAIMQGATLVGHFRDPGIQPEVASYLYRQIADVWKLDNEFAARWASYVYSNQDNRDLKVVMAAFMLCQNRKGDPVIKGGEVLFKDDDFRDVGEAMCLRYDIYDVLKVPEVVAINREHTRSGKKLLRTRRIHVR